MGLTADGRHLPFTDCRHVKFSVAVDDIAIFTINNAAKAQIPEENRGCTTVTLKAVSSGDTKVKVWFDGKMVALDISAYPPLKVKIPDSGNTFLVTPLKFLAICI